MHYLVASKAAAGLLPPTCRIVADGEMISFERPWLIGPTLVARLDDASGLAALKAPLAEAGHSAFAVEGVDEPGDGEALLVGGHIMRDAQAFAPYAAAVPETVRAYGGRFLARGGTVTPVAGSFLPGRVVLTEYPTAKAAVDWYTSASYAPLLKIRLAATEARLIIMARKGELPAAVRAAALDYLRRGA